MLLALFNTPPSTPVEWIFGASANTVNVLLGVLIALVILLVVLTGAHVKSGRLANSQPPPDTES